MQLLSHILKSNQAEDFNHMEGNCESGPCLASLVNSESVSQSFAYTYMYLFIHVIMLIRCELSLFKDKAEKR